MSFCCQDRLRCLVMAAITGAHSYMASRARSYALISLGVLGDTSCPVQSGRCQLKHLEMKSTTLRPTVDDRGGEHAQQE